MNRSKSLILVLLTSVAALFLTGCIADTFTGPAPDSGDPACCDGGADQDAGQNPQSDAAGDAGNADADAGQTCLACPDAGDAATDSPTTTDGSVAADSSTDGSSTDGAAADASDASDGGPVCTPNTKSCSASTVEQCNSQGQWQYLDSTNTDPDNCGACGHSCQGGVCSLGVCQDMTLELNQVALPIATDGVNVYWGSANAVKSAPVSGGTVTTVASGQNPVYLVLDSTNVYWASASANPNGIWTCPKNTANCTPTQVVSGIVPRVNAIAVDGANVYWAMDANTSGAAIVQQCSKSGCTTPITLATLQSGATAGNATGIAVDGTNVYWTDHYMNPTDNFEIDYCAVGGCSQNPTTLTVLSLGAWLIAVDNTNIYWGGSTINQCNKSNCTNKIMLANGQAGSNTGPTQLVVDSTNVYWSNYDLLGTGDIRACKIGTSCGNLQTAYNNAAIGPQVKSLGVAVDSTSIYWTNDNSTVTSGSIMKIAK